MVGAMKEVIRDIENGTSLNKDHSSINNLIMLIRSFDTIKPVKRKKKKVVRKNIRKTGEHLWKEFVGGFSSCVTCGCDEDDYFIGGVECSYIKE